MQLEIKDDVVSLVREALYDKSAEIKRNLQDLTSDCINMDMTSITQTVNNINELDDIINQIDVKNGLANANSGFNTTVVQDPVDE